MNLTIDVGNTNTLFCFFLFEKVIITEKIFTKEISENKLTKIIKMIKNNNLSCENMQVIISSVVPNVEKILKKFLKKKKKFPFFKKYNWKI